MLKAALFALVGLTASVSSMALELKGSLTQGGMIIGKLDKPNSVYFNGKALKITKEGEFVFGFGRDADTKHTLTWVDHTGKQHTQDIVITKREYKIDRITGVEKKYVSPPDSVLARIKDCLLYTSDAADE